MKVICAFVNCQRLWILIIASAHVNALLNSGLEICRKAGPRLKLVLLGSKFAILVALEVEVHMRYSSSKGYDFGFDTSSTLGNRSTVL